MKRIGVAEFILFIFPVTLFAQYADNIEGVQWRGITVRPLVEALVAHDTRIGFGEGGETLDDHYTEGSGGLEVYNLPARYRFRIRGLFGYRSYSEFSEQDDSFYSSQASISSDETPLIWRVGVDYRKILNLNPYNTDGTIPERSIETVLIDQSTRRLMLTSNVGYQKRVSEKLTFHPVYEGAHYHEEVVATNVLTGADDEEEWQEHHVGATLRHWYSDKTVLTATAGYRQQISDDELGRILNIEVGAESRLDYATIWQISIGIAEASYEESGSESAFVFNIRIIREVGGDATFYVFGGNGYLPSYRVGSARLVYQGGYGFEWFFAPRWTLTGQGVHDYQEDLNGNTSVLNKEGRYFITARCRYDFSSKLSGSAAIRFVNDELAESQTVSMLQLNYRY
ncbi:MAG TPA: hypothetical protein VIR63_03790 [Pontiella sp.]